MKYTLPHVAMNIHVVMQKAGYHFFRDPKSKKESYVSRLSRDYYPRFHVYFHGNKSGTELDLHLDMKKPSYAGSHAHSGEYDGKLVEEEMERLKAWFAYYSQGGK